MAITYPLPLPVSIGIAQITFRPINMVAISQSPFTFSQQVHAYAGEKWGADIVLPRMNKPSAEPWMAWLTALRGRYGTFHLTDPANPTPRGTATAATITGALGARSVTVDMTGTLLAGDYFSLGSGASKRLYKVLQDQSGDGTLEIWPALRAAASAATADLTAATGVFRLLTNAPDWTIEGAAQYTSAFSCEEAL